MGCSVFRSFLNAAIDEARCVTCSFDTFDSCFVEARVTEEEWMIRVKVLRVQMGTEC